MPIKVLMFGWEFPPFNSGGLGTACLGLTKALCAQNVAITFVLPKEVDVSPSHLKMRFAGVSIKRVDVMLSAYVDSKRYGLLRFGSGSLLYGVGLIDEVYRYALLAKEIAQSEDFQIIHAHDWLSFLAGIEAKKISGKPLIIHVHSTEFDRTGGNNMNQQVYLVERVGMEQADKIIAVSNFTKQLIVEKYGISSDKIEVIYNGVDQTSPVVEREHPLTYFKTIGCKVVLFVGRVTLQKGPDYFLKAAKKVLEYDPNVVFVIAGSGDMEEQLIEAAVNLGIGDKVIFTGFLRGEELNRIYQTADLFVLPSVSEPFGIAPLESVINGTPVLISKQSGVSEVLSHALKADFWDVEEMTDMILSVVGNPSLQKTLKQNSQEEVKKITWEKSANKCIEVYRQFIDSL